jgi:hypothetical protein
MISINGSRLMLAIIGMAMGLLLVQSRLARAGEGSSPGQVNAFDQTLARALKRGQSLGFEHGLLRPNSLRVGVICNDALEVKSFTLQYALLIGRRNLITRWKLNIEGRWRSTLR